jgi:phage tail-like protein
MADYPMTAFHFSVDWGGAKVGFSEVSGLTVETELVEYRDGSSPEFTKIKMPGLKKYSNITLKRGILSADNEFFDWFNQVQMNKPERRDVQIKLLNESHDPVMTWDVKNAWPVKVEGPGLKSDGNDVAVESIELAHEGVAIKNG